MIKITHLVAHVHRVDDVAIIEVKLIVQACIMRNAGRDPKSQIE